MDINWFIFHHFSLLLLRAVTSRNRPLHYHHLPPKFVVILDLNLREYIYSNDSFTKAASDSKAVYYEGLLTLFRDLIKIN
jgi:hypothetical protein